MDIINNRTQEIAKLALDGLNERAKAIGSNTVNALTPNYQRKEVSFEQSLQNVIKRENEKEAIKLQNSIQYSKNPNGAILQQTPEQISFLSSQIQDGYHIDIENDTQDPLGLDGNNVDIEREMMDEAKNGMQYQVVANLLSKSYASLGAVIKGQ